MISLHSGPPACTALRQRCRYFYAIKTYVSTRQRGNHKSKSLHRATRHKAGYSRANFRFLLRYHAPSQQNAFALSAFLNESREITESLFSWSLRFLRLSGGAPKGDGDSDCGDPKKARFVLVQNVRDLATLLGTEVLSFSRRFVDHDAATHACKRGVDANGVGPRRQFSNGRGDAPGQKQRTYSKRSNSHSDQLPQLPGSVIGRVFFGWSRFYRLIPSTPAIAAPAQARGPANA